MIGARCSDAGDRLSCHRRLAGLACALAAAALRFGASSGFGAPSSDIDNA